MKGQYWDGSKYYLLDKTLGIKMHNKTLFELAITKVPYDQNNLIKCNMNMLEKYFTIICIFIYGYSSIRGYFEDILEITKRIS